MADERSLRPARRRPTEPDFGDPWELERFDSVTPPPVDPDAARAWGRIRDRLEHLERAIAGVVPSIEALKGQVGELKSKDSEQSKSLADLTTSSALHTQSLSTIERGISELKASMSKDTADIKAQRSDDGTRFRFALQITTSLLAALAAIAVTVAGLVTR